MSSPSLSYFLFVVCTGVLFVRPAELVESLVNAPLYEVAILCGLTIAAPRILGQITTRSLVANPVTFCVVALVAAVALSHVSHLAIGDGARSAFAFLKVALSFLFCVAVLDSRARLRNFLIWLLVFILALAGLALLQHYEVIENPALAAHVERLQDKETGDTIGVNERLSGAGIFANPNDLSRILVLGITLALYLLDGGVSVLFRPFCVAAIAVLGHAFLLTQSRGGFTDLLATLFVLSWFRLGRTRTLLLAGAALPILFLAIAGRQTDLTTSEGTGQQRIRLWSDGLEELKSSPLFGIGSDQYSTITGGLGAHNSFVHAYVELGFFGGTLFAGAVIVALGAILTVVRRNALLDPRFHRLGVYLLAIFAGYAIGMLSSSRCYAFPTYYLLGLLVAYVRLAGGSAGLRSFRVTPRTVFTAILLSLLALVSIKVFVMSAASFGSQIFQT